VKFKIDENLPVEVGDILVRASHEALTVFDEALIGDMDGAREPITQALWIVDEQRIRIRE